VLVTASRLFVAIMGNGDQYKQPHQKGLQWQPILPSRHSVMSSLVIQGLGCYLFSRLPRRLCPQRNVGGGNCAASRALQVRQLGRGRLAALGQQPRTLS
jgi:hypothetical protein